MNHVVSPSPNALGPGFQMKPSPKHVTVTAFKVGTEGYTHTLTFFANKPTSFKSTRFFFKLGFELPRHCVGYLAVAKYTYRTPRATPVGWSRPRSRTSRATSASRAASPTRGLTARSRKRRRSTLRRESLYRSDIKSGVYNASDFK
jgi:hypothetical protein